MRWMLGLAALVFVAAPALAEYPGCMMKTAAGNCLPGMTDPNNAPFVAATVVAPDVAVTAGRSLGMNCSAAGNVALTLSNGSTLSIPAAVGFTVLPFAIVKVSSAGTTATCTYVNLS